MTLRTGSVRRIYGILKKLVELSSASRGNGWLSLARQSQASGLVAGATPVGIGGRWKSQRRKNVCLSPYIEEPLNSKVIKSFVPELRSRKCFLCFEIPMFYVYMLRTFYEHFTYPYHGYGTIRHKESDTQSFYADFSISPTTTTRSTPPQTTGLISASPKSQPSSSDAKTQLTDLSQIPTQILCAGFRCMT